MRPRLLHLGYDVSHCRLPPPVNSFNEAEAFTPRIQARAEEARKAEEARLQ